MKHIGLVLSGGMGKGAYQIGALMAISEFFKPSDFKYVSAASIGVLNTYAYLTNNLQSAQEIWESVNFKGDKRFITSILRSSFLQDIIKKIVTEVDISGTFYAPLLDLKNKELDYYNLANISASEIELYLRASIAMPFYNEGVKIGSKIFYDGAIIDNIPIYPVIENELDYAICIYFDDFNYVFEDCCLNDKIIKLTFPDNKILSNSVNISHDSIMYMIDEGYRRARQILTYIFSSGTENFEVIYSRIAGRNTENSEKIIRITGDVIVTNMNKLFKKIVRHKKILEEGVN